MLLCNIYMPSRPVIAPVVEFGCKPECLFVFGQIAGSAAVFL